jgi:hypothetical protein
MRMKKVGAIMMEQLGITSVDGSGKFKIKARIPVSVGRIPDTGERQSAASSFCMYII